MQLLVLGMHRAGTSITTRLVNLMGAYFAPAGMELPANKANPKGFWERKDVMRANDALLAWQHCRWDKPDLWLDRKCDDIPPELQQQMRGIVDSLNEHKPWVVKDPRLCITLPCWLPLLDNPIAIIASRHPWESARSLEFRNGLPLETGMALWEYHAIGIIRHARNLPHVFVRHEEAIADPLAATANLYEDLEARNVQGLNMPQPKDIREFVDSDLYRMKKPADAPRLSPHHEKIYLMLRGELEFDPHLQVSPQALQLIRARQP